MVAPLNAAHLYEPSARHSARETEVYNCLHCTIAGRRCAALHLIDYYNFQGQDNVQMSRSALSVYTCFPRAQP